VVDMLDLQFDLVYSPESEQFTAIAQTFDGSLPVQKKSWTSSDASALIGLCTAFWRSSSAFYFQHTDIDLYTHKPSNPDQLSMF